MGINLYLIVPNCQQVRRLEGEVVEAREAVDRERKLKENGDIMVRELENAIEKEQERAEEFKVRENISSSKSFIS